MRSVGTREIKQNPHAVIQRVLSDAEEVEITRHGHPTGVRLVPVRPARARWVPATALVGLSPLDEQDARELRALVEADRDADLLADPRGAVMTANLADFEPFDHLVRIVAPLPRHD